MSKILHGFSRVLFHALRATLFPVELVHPRVYMRVYVCILSAYGVRFSGAPRYISSKARFDDYSLVSIGYRVVISKYVILLTHDYSLTTALIAIGDVPQTDVAVNRGISIGDNVFIGIGAIILPGTKIGDNVIIGAGSVVRGEVQPDSILIGNPAVKIGTVTERSDHWRQMRSSSIVSIDDY